MVDLSPGSGLLRYSLLGPILIRVAAGYPVEVAAIVRVAVVLAAAQLTMNMLKGCLLEHLLVRLSIGRSYDALETRG